MSPLLILKVTSQASIEDTVNDSLVYCGGFIDMTLILQCVPLMGFKVQCLSAVNITGSHVV